MCQRKYDYVNKNSDAVPKYHFISSYFVQSCPRWKHTLFTCIFKVQPLENCLNRSTTISNILISQHT